MADFVSALTGVQMDSALIDMAEHNSEAWAVGERNGIAVDSSDVAYHNNAKYYASQAQSIAPASVTEAVRWDVAQTALTDAQREQARDNIEATGFNTNIFRNPWFNVNSRNFTTASVNGTNAYTVDGWRVGGIGTATKNANGTMTLAITASNFAGFTQFIDPKYMGETLRHSVMLADGTVYSLSGTMPSASGLNSYSYTINGATWQVLYRSDGTSLWVEFRCNVANTTLNIKAFKLEKSDFSTLKFDTPPDYGEELTRCIYSTADPNDTYANTGYSISNENLLDNPNFLINQRGYTNSTNDSSSYPADRWVIVANDGTLTNTGSGLQFAGTSTQNVRLRQYKEVDYFTYLLGKPITVSMIVDGVLRTATGVFPSTIPTGNTSIVSGSATGWSLSMTWQPAYNRVLTEVRVYGNAKITAAKVEVGTRSTLMMDTHPNTAVDLAKCQRYFRRIKEFVGGTRQICTGVAVSSSMARFTFPFVFRTTPSVAYSGLSMNYNGVISITSLNTPKATTDTVTLEVNATGLTAPAPIELQLASGGYLDLSADIV